MVHATPSTEISPKYVWLWTVLGLMLGCWIRWTIVDEISLGFYPSQWLPIWSAFMAYCFGARALIPMAIVAAWACVSVHLRFEDLDSLYVYFGQTAQGVLLAGFTAFALYPSSPRPFYSLLTRHWRWSVSAAWLVLALAQLPRSYTAAMHFAVEPWDYGAALVVATASTAVHHRTLLAYLRERWSGFRASTYALTWLLLFLAAATMPVEIEVNIGEAPGWSSRFTRDSLWGCGLALSFILVASRAFSLRRVLLLVVASCLIGLVGVWGLGHWWAGPGLETLTGDTTRLLMSSACNYSSFALLGAMTAHYWSTLDWSRGTTAWTPVFIGAILLLQFVALPCTKYGPDVLILGALAGTATLLWGSRALFAVPLALLLCTLLSSSIFGADKHVTLTLCMHLGASAFPFAFGGLLARRVRPREAL